MKIIVNAVFLSIFAVNTASAGDELLETAAAFKAFQEYASHPAPKIFAHSMHGAWAWAQGADAVEKDVLARCEKQTKWGHQPCAVVNIDGRWINEPSDMSPRLQDAYRCSTPAHCFDILLDSGNPPDMARMHVAMYRLAKFWKPKAGKTSNVSQAISAGNRGLVDLKAGNVESAIDSLCEATKSAPTFREFHIGLGVALLLRHRLEEAEGAFKNALLISPWSADAWAGLASVFQLKDRNDKALSALMLAYEWSPDKADAYSRFVKNSQAEGDDFMKPRYVEAVQAIALRAGALAKSREQYRLQKDAERKTADVESAQPDVPHRYAVMPRYPGASLRKNEQGTVGLQILIDAEGLVLDSYVEKSSGFVDLDNAARLSLAQSKFKPITIDGVAKQGWKKVDYVWRIE